MVGISKILGMASMMFEGDFKDMCANILLFMSMGGRVKGIVCADPGVRTSIGDNKNFKIFVQLLFRENSKNCDWSTQFMGAHH